MTLFPWPAPNGNNGTCCLFMGMALHFAQRLALWGVCDHFLFFFFFFLSDDTQSWVYIISSLLHSLHCVFFLIITCLALTTLQTRVCPALQHHCHIIYLFMVRNKRIRPLIKNKKKHFLLCFRNRSTHTHPNRQISYWLKGASGNIHFSLSKHKQKTDIVFVLKKKEANQKVYQALNLSFQYRATYIR